MIVVKPITTKKGTRLYVGNQNGEIFNHFYNKRSGAKKAWNNFVKQIKADKVKFIK